MIACRTMKSSRQTGCATIKLSVVAGLTLAGVTAHTAEPARPLVVAHRGLLRHAPENTLSNFRACLELRLGFEFDVRRTKDGTLVCVHDETVNRTTDGTGKVADLSLDKVRRLDAGSWFGPEFSGERVPTVEEILKLLADYRHREVLVAVDLKADNVAGEVVRLGEKHGVLDRLLFIGTAISDPAVRREIRQASREAHAGAVANTPAEFEQALAAPDADWVYFRFLPTAEQIGQVHRAGKKRFIAGGTVSGNVPENWRRAAEVGLDGVLTDYPLELRAVLSRNADGK
jgi:glycerophosphoryl diester phosphodiesterase